MSIRSFFLALWKKHEIAIELFLILGWCIIGFLHSAKYNFLERFYLYSRAHESWNLDEWVAVVHVLALAFALFAFRRLWEIRKMRNELLKKNLALEKSMAEIKTLQGIIPICARCKKIRDDKGFWTQVEAYIQQHTDAAFTHGVCPDCREETLAEYRRNKALRNPQNTQG